MMPSNFVNSHAVSSADILKTCLCYSLAKIGLILHFLFFVAEIFLKTAEQKPLSKPPKETTIVHKSLFDAISSTQHVIHYLLFFSFNSILFRVEI